MVPTQNVPEIRGITLVAAELDKYTAVFSSNLKFCGLFISPKRCHTAAFPFVFDNNNKFIGCRHIGFCN